MRKRKGIDELLKFMKVNNITARDMFVGSKKFQDIKKVYKIKEMISKEKEQN